MAYSQGPNMVISLVAGEDLSAKQYHFVRISDAGTCINVTADSTNPVGVLQNAPASGEAAQVLVAGVTKLECNAAVANAGSELACNFTTSASNAETGRAQAAVVGQHIAARNLTAAGAQGDIITAVVTFDGRIKL